MPNIIIDAELKKLQEALDPEQLKTHPLKKLHQQLELLIKGIALQKLAKPCKIGDGIIRIDESQSDELLKNYEAARISGRFIKFVPASGAASRMFQRIQKVLDKYSKFTLNELIELAKTDDDCKSAYRTIENLEKFAFYDELKNLIEMKGSPSDELIKNNPRALLEFILYEKGLDYLSKPKGLIEFHKYSDSVRTAFEEHLDEAVDYVMNEEGKAQVHFTISEKHLNDFKKTTNKFLTQLNNKNIKLKIEYSYQKESTDTISITVDNQIYFENDKPFFRQGGHGALLENLNDLKADLIFIKNIDNVSTEKRSRLSTQYKKLLAGFLVMVQKQVFTYLNLLENPEIKKIDIEEILKFSKSFLGTHHPNGFLKWNSTEQKQYLIKKLNRPIRVCGVVKNEGHPGGAPFWVEAEDKEISLQIIEKAQVDLENPEQQLIFNNSTHFNPVDIVCGVRNYKGQNFDLLEYQDPKSGIIVTKFKNAVEIKALELPGLWNGSMANWITIFVEIPGEIFNPVKELNDLLSPGHQSED